MIGIADKSQEVQAFFQVSRDLARYFRFGASDSISEIVDSSYKPIDEICALFKKNPDLIPDDTYTELLYNDQTLYRANKLNDLTYNIEYDLVHGDDRAYMTMYIQFVRDEVEPYTSVELKDIKKN